MDRSTVLTKTAKGLMETSGKTSLLSRDLRDVLKEVDGRGTVGELQKRLDRPEPKLLEALGQLVREGFIREFVTVHMKTHEIDTVRVHDKVKVNLNTKNAKGGITKEVIKKGLLTYFSGDEVRTEGAFQAITDAAPVTSKSSVTVVGLKAMLE